MKKFIITSVRLTLVCILLFMMIYPAFIWIIAKAAPAKGEGETITKNGVTVGYRLEGQNFTQDKYFQGRPSAVAYNAAGSGGSNKGASNPDYLKDVNNRIDSILVHNPGIGRESIPSDLVTASGSGLDPDISVAAATIQIPRIARVRKIDPLDIKKLVERNIEKSFINIEKINVLKLNVQLDEIK